MIDNHTATQHEFTRKCLRFFYDDIPQEEYDGSEDDLREYAATINEGFGYDLDAQLAALTADVVAQRGQRDALQAKVDALILFVNGKLTRAEMDSRLEGLVLK